MVRRALALMLALAAIAVPVTAAGAQEQTKREVVARSGEICQHARAAMAKHIRRAARALRRRGWNAYARHGRRYARIGIRHVRRLRKLRPPASRFHYKRFVARSRSALGWIELAMDAYDEERFKLGYKRERRAEGHRERAKRSAREYGLRRACVRFLEV